MCDALPMTTFLAPVDMDGVTRGRRGEERRGWYASQNWGANVGENSYVFHEGLV